LFLVSLQSSAELTRLEAKARTLAESVALLELRVRELDPHITDTSTSGPTEPTGPTEPVSPDDDPHP